MLCSIRLFEKTTETKVCGRIHEQNTRVSFMNGVTSYAAWIDAAPNIKKSSKYSILMC